MIYLLPNGIQELSPCGTLTIFQMEGITAYSSQDLLRTLCGNLTDRGKYPQYTVDIFGALVAAEFYRTVIDKHYPEWKILRHWKKEIKQWIRAEAFLWYKAWECLERMNSLNAWNFKIPITHPAIGLSRLVGEGLIIGFAAGSDDATNVEQLIRDKQSETQKMRFSKKSNNPKNPYQSGFTKTFVDAAIQLAERSDTFKNDRWAPFLEGRSELIKAWRNIKPEFIDEKTGLAIHGKSISIARTQRGKGFQTQNTLPFSD